MSKSIRPAYLLWTITFFLGTALSAAVPENLAVTPGEGTSYAGQPTVIAAEFRDLDGHGDLNMIMVKVNQSLADVSACQVAYFLDSGLLALSLDESSDWQSETWAPGTPGAVLENSHCIIDVEASLVGSEGADVFKLTLHMRFKEEFIGSQPTKNVYLTASDEAGHASPWEVKGRWTIRPANEPTAPTASLVEPATPTSSYVNQDAYVTVDYSDQNGWDDLVFMQLRINEDSSGNTACYLLYNRFHNRLYLRDDEHSFWMTGGTPGAPGATVEGTQCRLDVGRSSVTPIGTDTLRLRANITFKDGFLQPGILPSSTDDKTVYIWASDVTGRTTGNWIDYGVWTVLAPAPPTPPMTGDLFPAMPATLYANEEVEILAEFKDANGAADIRSSFLGISQGLTSNAVAVNIRYIQLYDRFFLKADDGESWVDAGVPVGTPGAVLENSSVRVDIGGSSVEAVGDTLTWRLRLTLKEPLLGARNITITAYDADGQFPSGGIVWQGPMMVDEALRVCLMADPQFGLGVEIDPVNLEEQAENADRAMADFGRLDHSALFILGDLVQKADYWPDYRFHIGSRTAIPIYPLAGNSDLLASDFVPNDGLDRFQEETGSPLYYTVFLRGIRFIVLSTMQLDDHDHHICGLGDDQLNWLHLELLSDTNSTTVILFHAPVYDTTFGSVPDEMYGNRSFYAQDSPLLSEWFEEFPNIAAYASGHVHSPLDEVDSSGRNHFALRQGVLHLRVGATANGRSSVCLTVQHDQIKSRARHHGDDATAAAWRPELEVVYPLQTTLELQ